jgi:hypothetical protein
MIRTQIQLTEPQVQNLKLLAVEEGVSMAELIRRSVDQLLSSSSENERVARERAIALIGRFHSDHDLSEAHDDYLAEAFAE